MEADHEIKFIISLFPGNCQFERPALCPVEGSDTREDIVVFVQISFILGGGGQGIVYANLQLGIG